MRQLATADPTTSPPVMPPTGSEMINLRLSSTLMDEPDAAAEAERTTRKVIVTRALAKAGFHVPPHGTPQQRGRTNANGQRPAA